jgi:hypothetical protein
MRAWYKKAMKPLFLVCSCTAKAVFGFCRCWWSARTSVLGGASMKVEGAGLFAEACHMLCQDCWTLCIVRFRRLSKQQRSSSVSH